VTKWCEQKPESEKNKVPRQKFLFTLTHDLSAPPTLRFFRFAQKTPLARNNTWLSTLHHKQWSAESYKLKYVVFFVDYNFRILAILQMKLGKSALVLSEKRMRSIILNCVMFRAIWTLKAFLRPISSSYTDEGPENLIQISYYRIHVTNIFTFFTISLIY